MKLKVYEAILKVYLLEDISYDNALSSIAKLIDKSFTHTNEMQKFHHENKFKNYTYNSFYPIENNKIYKAGKMYSIQLRSLSLDLMKYFKIYLTNEFTDTLKVLTFDYKPITQRFINELYSLTPVVIKTEEGYWGTKISLAAYEEKLRNTLLKKYNSLGLGKLPNDTELFTCISLINKKPISVKIKDVKLLGDKVKLQVCDSPDAQLVSYLTLGYGLGEINARGCGFVNFVSE